MRIKYGSANFTGFEIKGDNGIVVNSKNYIEDDSAHRDFLCKKFFFVFVLLAGISMMGHILLFFSKINNVRFLLSIIFLLVLDVLMWVLFIVFHNKKFRQWHACEHKAENLINKGLDLTLENLKKMSRVHPHCFSRVMFPLIGTLLACYLLLTLTEINVIKSLWYSILFGVIFFLWVEIYPIATSIQYLITHEPDEEQLQEALGVAKEFLKKYQEFTNGSLK